MLRAFIAVTPPPDIQQSAETVRHAFANHAHAWRWINPQTIHLTLRFLGNVAPDAVADIHQAMRQAIDSQPAFTLHAQGLGCFPNLTRARVLWMGIEDPQHILTSLYHRLEAALSQRGFATETRPFHPHLTLARARQRIDQQALATHLQTHRQWLFGTIPVERLELFQSELRPEGAVYTVLNVVPLQPGTNGLNRSE